MKSSRLIPLHLRRRRTNPLDASGGSALLNLLDAPEGALIRAAASTQTLAGFLSGLKECKGR
jgi:hypothetical protein